MSRVISASTRRTHPKPARGNVQQLPSGSWRVRVYAGINPATRRPCYVSETVPDGPDALLEVEDVRQRLLAVCRSHGQGNANVAELINRHILLLAISETTRQRYFELATTHIVPMIGHIQIRDLTPEILEGVCCTVR